MITSLAEPKLKLDRAGKHLKDFEEVLVRFLLEERDRISEEFDAKAGCKNFWLEPRATPPEWGPVIGDVLYNCRSALDQLANRLVESATGTRKRSRTGKTAWPIYANSTDFLCYGRPKIAGMSAKAKAIVENAQPYVRSLRGPKNDLLWLLNDLTNEDKHRNLHLTLTTVRSSGGYGDLDIRAVHLGPVEHRTKLASIGMSASDVDVQFHFALGVAFAKRTWLGRPLVVDDFFRRVIIEIEAIFGEFMAYGLIAP